ncbi:uncharacterized protein [Dermacentor albipictus]|uniref:uncharacterized protein n=1 Tax=Dermacentor albipictus TaxID=60249 RepID=UPI0038FC06DB
MPISTRSTASPQALASSSVETTSTMESALHQLRRKPICSSARKQWPPSACKQQRQLGRLTEGCPTFRMAAVRGSASANWLARSSARASSLMLSVMATARTGCRLPLLLVRDLSSLQARGPLDLPSMAEAPPAPGLASAAGICTSVLGPMLCLARPDCSTLHTAPGGTNVEQVEVRSGGIWLGRALNGGSLSTIHDGAQEVTAIFQLAAVLPEQGPVCDVSS